MTFARSFLDELRSLVEHRFGYGGYIASDSLARLDQPALDRTFAGQRDVEDVYPLTPTQLGMLFHTLWSPGSTAYFEQLACTIQGLDTAAFETAWEGLLARHPVLRTGFLWEGLPRPLQVVRARARLPIERLDFGGDGPAAQEASSRRSSRRPRARFRAR